MRRFLNFLAHATRVVFALFRRTFLTLVFLGLLGLNVVVVSVDAAYDTFKSGLWWLASAFVELSEPRLIRDLKRENIGLKRTNNGLKRTNKRLKTKLTTTTTKLKSAKKKIKTLSDDLGLARKGVRTLSADLEAKRAEIKRLGGTLDKSSKRIGTLKHNLKVKVARIKTLRGSLIRASKEIKTLTSKIEIKQGEIRRLSDDLGLARRGVRTLSADLEAKRAEINRLNGTLDSASKTIRTLGKDLRGKKAEIIRLSKILNQTEEALKKARVIPARVVRRHAKRLTREIASLPAEAVPYLGIGVVVGLTYLDIKDTCETIREVNELAGIIKGTTNTDTSVCGTTLKDLWRKVRNKDTECAELINRISTLEELIADEESAPDPSPEILEAFRNKLSALRERLAKECGIEGYDTTDLATD